MVWPLAGSKGFDCCLFCIFIINVLFYANEKIKSVIHTLSLNNLNVYFHIYEVTFILSFFHMKNIV